MTEVQQNDMYQIVQKDRKTFGRLIVLHILCVFSLIAGLSFACLYMKMPDRVIVMARDHSVYLGNSSPLDSERVLHNAALRAADALLCRRYDVENDRAVNFVFTRRGQGQAKSYLNDTQEMFEERQIFQAIETASVETAVLGGRQHALVKGILVRQGVYFGHPYRQKRDFALMMRMEKSQSDLELPYKVAGMRFYEEERTDEPR